MGCVGAEETWDLFWIMSARSKRVNDPRWSLRAVIELAGFLRKR